MTTPSDRTRFKLLRGSIRLKDLPPKEPRGLIQLESCIPDPSTYLSEEDLLNNKVLFLAENSRGIHFIRSSSPSRTQRKGYAECGEQFTFTTCQVRGCSTERIWRDIVRRGGNHSDILGVLDRAIDPLPDYRRHLKLIKSLGGYLTRITFKDYTYCKVSLGIGFLLSLLVHLGEIYVEIWRRPKRWAETRVEWRVHLNGSRRPHSNSRRLWRPRERSTTVFHRGRRRLVHLFISIAGSPITGRSASIG